MANHTRKFDWNEARRLYHEHRTYAAVARILNVTPQAIRLAIDPQALSENRAYHERWQRETQPWVGQCIDCGARATRAGRGRSRHGRCKKCEAFSKTSAVRTDTLRCSACRYWLPDEAFPHQSAAVARRGRHQLCRPCQNVARQLYRETHREQERTRDRDRKRAARAAAKAVS